MLPFLPPPWPFSKTLLFLYLFVGPLSNPLPLVRLVVGDWM